MFIKVLIFFFQSLPSVFLTFYFVYFIIHAIIIIIVVISNILNNFNNFSSLTLYSTVVSQCTKFYNISH